MGLAAVFWVGLFVADTLLELRASALVGLRAVALVGLRVAALVGLLMALWVGLCEAAGGLLDGPLGVLTLSVLELLTCPR